MVMASASLYQRHNAHDVPHEGAEARDEAAAAAALHERLVAYVHALSGGHEPRSGVWVEHSYARARGAAAAPAAAPRLLLAPRAPPAPAEPDVERIEREPAPPPHDALEDDAPDDDEADDGDETDDGDCEARVAALAPTAAHARLADTAFETLRRMRLARLAGGRAARGETARAAARRLRLALAAAGAARPRAAPWLHAALLAHLPRASRALYDAAVAALWRAAPAVAARLAGGRAPGGGGGGGGARGAAVAQDAAGAWLVWVGGGRAGLEERWARRLGALVHVVRAAAEPAAGALPAEAWCSAAAGGARAALAAALDAAGERAVFMGGVGAGAALCAALAGAAGARVRGLVLLAPPLLTAEGEEGAAAGSVPTLVVVGSGAAGCWRGAAGAARRVLAVRGADAALRLPRRLRARLRLPQHALDAAVAEECARWIAETAESDDAHERERERERERPRRRGADPEDEEYSHLPGAGRAPAPPAGAAPAAAPPAPAAPAPVVSRGPGGTPLALLPPRRAPAAPLAAADIMHLPIVFADDEPAAGGEPPAPAASPVTVTSGEREREREAGARYTRVIVAKRGAGGGGGGARPVLLRRGLRLVPRDQRR